MGGARLSVRCWPTWGPLLPQVPGRAAPAVTHSAGKRAPLVCTLRCHLRVLYPLFLNCALPVSSSPILLHAAFLRLLAFTASGENCQCTGSRCTKNGSIATFSAASRQRKGQRATVFARGTQHRTQQSRCARSGRRQEPFHGVVQRRRPAGVGPDERHVAPPALLRQRSHKLLFSALALALREEMAICGYKSHLSGGWKQAAAKVSGGGLVLRCCPQKSPLHTPFVQTLVSGKHQPAQPVSLRSPSPTPPPQAPRVPLSSCRSCARSRPSCAALPSHLPAGTAAWPRAGGSLHAWVGRCAGSGE